MKQCQKRFEFATAMIIVLTGGLVAAGSTDSGPSASQDDQVRDAVRELLHSRHGLAFANQDQKTLVARIRNNPAEYAPAVAEALQLPRKREALESTSERQVLERALQLAELLGRDHAAESVHKFYDDTEGRVAEARGKPNAVPLSDRARRNVLSLRRTTLKTMGRLADGYAIDRSLASIEVEDLATRTVMLQYLGSVARGNAAVQQAMTRMIEDTNSPLHRYPQAVKVLDEISKPREAPKDATRP